MAMSKQTVMGRGLSVAVAMLLPMVLGTGHVVAQVSGAPTDLDKHFLTEIAQDSNYEIKTGQLALKKSQSADVKAYATMLIHDHTQLKQQIKVADATAKVTPSGADSLSLSDRASYTKLELLSGDTFDQAYLKGLVKGNDEIQKDEKAEATESAMPAVKKLAAHSAALDMKHAEKAKELATAHKVAL